MFGSNEPESIDLIEDKIAETVKDPRGMTLLQYIYTSTKVMEATLELAEVELVNISNEDGSPADLDELLEQVESNKVELDKLAAEFGLEFTDEI